VLEKPDDDDDDDDDRIDALYRHYQRNARSPY
jgi:hypothetical protein